MESIGLQGWISTGLRCIDKPSDPDYNQTHTESAVGCVRHDWQGRFTPRNDSCYWRDLLSGYFADAFLKGVLYHIDAGVLT